jgi:hypothetical protein
MYINIIPDQGKQNLNLYLFGIGMVGLISKAEIHFWSLYLGGVFNLVLVI